MGRQMKKISSCHSERRVTSERLNRGPQRAPFLRLPGGGRNFLLLLLEPESLLSTSDHRVIFEDEVRHSVGCNRAEFIDIFISNAPSDNFFCT